MKPTVSAIILTAIFAFVLFSSSIFYVKIDVQTNFYKAMKFTNLTTLENLVYVNESVTINDFEQWIVITSTSLPTPDIQKMAELKNWKIVIVADQKTPNNWQQKNCYFLSLEKQKMLNYKIIDYLPFNSYTRKMIGYLYAIQHGAKFIYDTDDDNLPINSGLNSFDFNDFTSALVYQKLIKDGSDEERETFFNVYSHFGRSDVWPRGYPLNKINENEEFTYKLCEQIRTPVIQQGLVNQDADVDAIYRLVFAKNKSKGLDIGFDPYAPPVVLPEKTYCPFNSQNTLFHYNAFWAMLLPTTVTFRVTDIWRGYWAQRLLHLTGNRVGFYPANARQNRNPHNYLKDFTEESQLYIDTGKLVENIHRWRCKSNEFAACIIELSEFMALNHFWKTDDINLTKAWINDLHTVGYLFPTMENETLAKNESCRSAHFVSNLHRKQVSRSYISDNLKKISKLCKPFVHCQIVDDDNTGPSFNHTKNIILIVVINRYDFVQIPLLQLLYEPWFANVIFCANFPDNLSNMSSNSGIFAELWEEYGKFSYVNLQLEEIDRGFFLYMCLNKISNTGFQNIDGYLVIADDMLLNFWNPFDVTNITYSKSCYYPAKKMAWWNDKLGVHNLKSLETFLNNNSMENNLINENLRVEIRERLMEPMFCTSDIYYVPVHLVKPYQILAQLFYDHKVFVEVAVPKILYFLGWAKNDSVTDLEKVHYSVADDVVFKGVYMANYRDNTRGNVISFSQYRKNDTFLHPVKWAFIVNVEWRKLFCTTYVSSLIENVIGS